MIVRKQTEMKKIRPDPTSSVGQMEIVEDIPSACKYYYTFIITSLLHIFIVSSSLVELHQASTSILYHLRNLGLKNISF